MATFGKATFNAARYASFRPTYPRQLYDSIFHYHGEKSGARWDIALDLGCGTGAATLELTPFKRIIGLDPSATMISQAKKVLQENHPALAQSGQIEYVQGDAENLAFLEDGSVDLIVSSQAAHWFDWGKLWPEVARVLRKNGSIAVWGYSEFRISGFPSLTPLISEYSQGSDSLGPYWEQPGRGIVDNHFLAIPSATETLPDKFSDFQRVYYTGAHNPSLPDPRPVILRNKTTWEGLHSYLRTFSSLHTYHERHPEDLKNPEGDISTRFMNKLKSEAEKAGVEGEEIVVELPLTLLLAKRT